MGNSHSNSHKDDHLNAALQIKQDVKCFIDISRGQDVMSQHDLERALGEKIGSALWRNTFKYKADINQDEFSKHFNQLFDIQSTQCTNLFPNVRDFLDACLSTVGKDLNDEDSEFVSSLVKDAKKDGVANYFATYCPGLAQNTILRHIKSVFCPLFDHIVFVVDSTILSPLQMLLIQGALSEMVYFKHKQSNNKKPCWTKLYESHSQGLSVNRFETSVFGYKAPTVSIFKLTDGKIFVIANNTEWRHTTKYIGSVHSICIQVAPTLKFFNSRHQEPIMCNFKYRTVPYRLGFLDVFTIDGEFSNVDAIEVWACGDESAADDQKSLKDRQRMQAERNAKCPMPGTWDDNPDKAVMEMAGFKFSNERNRPEPPHEDDD